MNAAALLLALLVVAYIGSSLALSRGVRGYSSPSGVEYVLLGVALGPGALGLVERTTLASMTPIAVFGLGWIALEQGVECGFAGERRVSWKRAVLGCVLAGLLATTIATVVHVVLERLHLVERADVWWVSIGVALVSCESTRHGLRWVREHHGAEGPLSQLISDISSADSAVPLVALGWWFTARAQALPPVLLRLPSFGLALAELVFGALLGLLVTALLKTTTRAVDGWGVVLGGALIGVGVTHGAGMSWLTTLFAMGVTLSLFAIQRERVRVALEQSEHAVLLPILVLAGAHIDLKQVPDLALILPVAFVARVAFTLVVGNVARVVSPIAARAGVWLGPSLMSSGAVTVCIGFACALHRPGLVGQMILAAAVVDTLMGELIGPIALRRSLQHAGEVNGRDAGSTPTTPTTELRA